MASKKIRDIYEYWQWNINPLRGLTQTSIEQMMSNARLGYDVRLQRAFREIEKQSPIYQVCISKRTSGVLERKYDVIPNDDSQESKDQADFIRGIITKSNLNNECGFESALKHLCLATFRGRSIVRPYFNGNDLMFETLSNSQYLHLDIDGKWYKIPDDGKWKCDIRTEDLELIEVNPNEHMYLLNESPVDVPGLTLYLRQLVGEEQWARFVEKSGIAQILLTAPDGTSEQELAKFNLRAQAIYEGASGVLPYGSSVDEMTSARGQNPFVEYCKHQMEMISIMATGGTLMTIGGSSGLGSDLARVQQESFNSLVTQDCKSIQNSVNSTLLNIICQHFNIKELKCHFEFIEDDKTSVQEYLQYAKMLKDLGVEIDIAKLKEVTKLTFIDENKLIIG